MEQNRFTRERFGDQVREVFAPICDSYEFKFEDASFSSGLDDMFHFRCTKGIHRWALEVKISEIVNYYEDGFILTFLETMRDKAIKDLKQAENGNVPL